MKMSKEIYERLFMDVTEFDAEDVVTTSGWEFEYDPEQNESVGANSYYTNDF